MYVGQLNRPSWASVEAETQFQAAGSSHELAALLLTETIQHSIFVNDKPVYALALDAMSAFDNIVRQCVIRSAYLAGTTDSYILMPGCPPGPLIQRGTKNLWGQFMTHLA